VRAGNGELAAHDPGARGAQDLAQLLLRPDAAERAGARPDHGHGLVRDRGGATRARCPVDRVLQLAGNGRVVLGRGDQDRVRPGDRVAQTLDSWICLLAVVVLVVRRQRLQLVIELQLDAGRK